LVLLFIPAPPILIDLFLCFSIALAVLVLLVSFYILRPLDFSIFPTLLLIITLFRLSLSVAATRRILLFGNTGPSAAGEVIRAFGEFVIGGNYVTGVIIFGIIVTINFVVITKGAQRIAEVAARFILDAMPGKQMSIDADLNAGLITEEEARKRRTDISKEADFYGAMDGASKFIRGDAVASLIILSIAILGGISVGVLMQGLDLVTALRTYTLLSVGEGLLAQIPALIVSVGAGVVITRSATPEVCRPNGLSALVVFTCAWPRRAHSRSAWAYPRASKAPFPCRCRSHGLLGIPDILKGTKRATGHRERTSKGRGNPGEYASLRPPFCRGRPGFNPARGRTTGRAAAS